MDKTTFALCKKLAAGAVSGVDSMSVEGQTLTINCKDGTVLTMTFPTPADGVSITDVEIDASNHLICTLSDGSTEDAGEIHTVKGEKGDKGDKGDAGQGIAQGGSEGQMLVKNSDSDYDTKWVTPPGGTVVDDEMSLSSENPVQNKVITAAIGDKVDKADKAIVDGVGTALEGKVDKISGKGLSTNDYDDTEKAKVAAAITKAVDDLVNYYTKSQTYTKTEVDNIAATIRNSRFEVVSVLPTTDIQTNVIYLVPKSTAQTNNIKDEYINLDGTTAGWEKIGDTEIDLSGYVTTTALNTALADYTTTTDLTALLAGKTNLTVISPAFVETRDYAVNSYVTHDGKLYKCTTAHTAGAWDANDFTEITVVGAKADKVSGATSGHFAGLNGNGNLTDSGKSASDFGTADEIADIVNVYGAKNLIPYPYLNKSGTEFRGVTYTVNADESITANGTATGGDSAFFILQRNVDNDFLSRIGQGNFILSGCPANGSLQTYYLNFNYGDAQSSVGNLGQDTGNGKEITIDTDITQYNAQITVLIREGVTVSNLTFYPMLRMASVKDNTYVPYVPTNKELADSKADKSDVDNIAQSLIDYEVVDVKNMLDPKWFNNASGCTVTTSYDKDKVTKYVLTGTTTSGNGVLFARRVAKDLTLPVGKTFVFSIGTALPFGSLEVGYTHPTTGAWTIVKNQATDGLEFTVPAEADGMPWTIQYLPGNNKTLDNFDIFPMLCTKEDWDKSHDYEPFYIPVKDAMFRRSEQGVLGAKNLIQNMGVAQTVSGVTFTLNADGSVTANGTATAAIPFNVSGNILDRLDPTQEYILSGCPKGGSASTYRIYVSYQPGNGNLGNDYGDGVRFSLSSTSVTYTTIVIYIFISSGAVLNNIVFRPMLRLASDPDGTYQPYAKTNFQLTNEGPLTKAIPLEWNENLNLDSNKGGNIYQYGKLYFVTYWFKATTATTGNVGIVKLPKNGLIGGNYVITEGNDTAVWGGKTTIDGVDYVSISCPMVVDKVYRAQCVWIDNS